MSQDYLQQKLSNAKLELKIISDNLQLIKPHHVRQLIEINSMVGNYLEWTALDAESQQHDADVSTLVSLHSQYPDTEEGAIECMEAVGGYDPEQVKRVVKSNIHAGAYAIDMFSGCRIIVSLKGYGLQKDATENQIEVSW